MIYVLLDTNIIIDMVIDRRKNLKANLLRTFIQFMDQGDIRVVLPAIVKTETYRHLDSELDKIETMIGNAIKDVKGLYGVITYDIDPLDIMEIQENAKKELNKAKNEYIQHKKEYSKDIRDTIDRLFQHENTILIDDEQLMAKVLKRRVHQKAPFHKVKKESYGDGTITETLINIGELLPTELTESDRIFFVSGNTSDFSVSKKEDLAGYLSADDYKKLSEKMVCNYLHRDIHKDLIDAGLIDKVEYVTSLIELIHPHLESMISNELLSEFDQELEIMEEEYNDVLCERVGIESIGHFAANYEEEIRNSEFAQKMVEQFERLNSANMRLEELAAFFGNTYYFDEFDLKEIVTNMSSLADCSDEPTFGNLRCVLEWMIEQKQSCEILFKQLPDSIDPNKRIEFWDINGIRYMIQFDGFDYLSPYNGGSDTIDVYLKTGDDIVEKGYIKANYSFIEYSDYGIENYSDEDVNYRTNNIIEALNKICDEWEDYVTKKNAIAEQIQDKFGKYQL